MLTDMVCSSGNKFASSVMENLSCLLKQAIGFQVLQKAVCPEKRIGIDSAVSAIASVTEVEVSTDLAIAKVYLSIFSDDLGKSIAMSGLKRLEGYVRKHIATSMNLRMAPEVRFLQDDTIARAEHVRPNCQAKCSL